MGQEREVQSIKMREKILAKKVEQARMKARAQARAKHMKQEIEDKHKIEEEEEEMKLDTSDLIQDIYIAGNYRPLLRTYKNCFRFECNIIA